MTAPVRIFPDGLWSLWDMVANFNFSTVHHLLGELNVLITVSHHNMRVTVPVGGALTRAMLDDPNNQKALADCKKSSLELADLTEKNLACLKCSHIENAIRALKYWASAQPPEWSELNTRARALRDVILTELRGYLFYQYPLEKGRQLHAWKADWQTVTASFPGIQWDVYDAVDCYGLQKNTASVFHSMRVAEHGLRALAKERRIKLPKDKPLEWGTWQEIIKELDDAIKVVASKKAGEVKDAALAFYSGARADLNGFKDEYRNVVMHVRITYDDLQALRALTKVHAFMQRLAAKIDHTHQRIKWGKF